MYNQMKKFTASLLGLLLVLLTACSSKSEDTFSIKVICESKDIYQLFYTCYVGNEVRGMGGYADLDGAEITENTDITITFPASQFNENDNLSDFTIDFSPYGKNDTSEIATTKRILVSAKYGETYTIYFRGNETDGFYAELS